MLLLTTGPTHSYGHQVRELDRDAMGLRTFGPVNDQQTVVREVIGSSDVAYTGLTARRRLRLGPGGSRRRSRTCATTRTTLRGSPEGGDRHNRRMCSTSRAMARYHSEVRAQVVPAMREEARAGSSGNDRRREYLCGVRVGDGAGAEKECPAGSSPLTSPKEAVST